MRLRVSLAAMIALLVPSVALAGDLTVREVTKYYSISGRTAAELAASMSRKGPYSSQHRRRAWATASRKMSYQLTRERTSRGCRVKRAKVTMRITYVFPRPTSLARVSGRQRSKWKQMYGLLRGHEKVHGRYYRQLANNVQRRLRKLRTKGSCSNLDRQARAIVKKMSDADSRKNDRFDMRDTKTYRKVERLYTSS